MDKRLDTKDKHRYDNYKNNNFKRSGIVEGDENNMIKLRPIGRRRITYRSNIERLRKDRGDESYGHGQKWMETTNEAERTDKNGVY